MPEKLLALDVLMVPGLLAVKDLSRTHCAVMDILRATTTITTAFMNGAKEVFPCLNADEARSRAGKLNLGSYLLGGEQKGLKIPGFDLGNSPLEYSPEIVTGKTIIFSTTNGTPTMRTTYSRSKLPVYIVSLLNQGAVAKALLAEAGKLLPAKIALICSGTHGTLALEDTYCAGLIVKQIEALAKDRSITLDLADGAAIAGAFSALNKDRALIMLSTGHHGQELLELGFKADLEFAAQVDKYQVTPVFAEDRITLPKATI